MALNHLKRLRPQGRGLAPGDAERLARVSRALHAAAARDMPRLGPRHLALAVNAAVPRLARPRGPRAPARAACGVLGGAGAGAGNDARRKMALTLAADCRGWRGGADAGVAPGRGDGGRPRARLRLRRAGGDDAPPT